MFKKSDLKDRDIVTYRNGEKRIAVKGKLINDDGCVTSNLCFFQENLENRHGEDYDIVKVERPAQYDIVFKRKKEILDEVEKKYLKDVIRPFRKETELIEKRDLRENNKEYIAIQLKRSFVYLPDFKRGTMYRGMQANKEYTLEELGL